MPKSRPSPANDGDKAHAEYEYPESSIIHHRSRLLPMPLSPIVWQQSSKRRPGGPPEHHFKFPSAHSGDSGEAAQNTIAIVVTAYNEEARELRRTLRGLNGCMTDELRRLGFRLCVVVVFDGMEHMHPSCEALVSSLVGSSTGISELRGASRFAASCTFFSAVLAQGQMEYPNLNLSLIVKRDNRGKANSLEWFFRSFCPAYCPVYAITTDAGTVFSPRALEVIDATFRARPRVAALCNQFNVLTATEEGVTDTYFQAALRSAQQYEKGDTYSVSIASFSDFGFIPVLSGFTSAFKYSEIQGRALDVFLATQNQESGAGFATQNQGHQGGSIAAALGSLIRENAKLTEDVNIGLAANFESASNGGLSVQSVGLDGDTRWDPEITVEKLVQQRRRWTNGGLACYLIYFFRGAWCRSGHSAMYKAYFCCFVAQVLFSIPFLILMPAVCAIRLYGSAMSFFEETGGFSARSPASLASVFVLVYVISFLAFCWRHVTTKSASPFFFVLSIVINLMGEGFATATLAARLWRFLFSPAMATQSLATYAGAVMHTCIHMAVNDVAFLTVANFFDCPSTTASILHKPVVGPCVVILHQFLEFLRGRRRNVKPWVVVKNQACYWFILRPMLGPFFFVFCIMRMDDFRWGNRPGAVSGNLDVVGSRKSWVTIVRSASFLVIFLNLALIYYPGSYDSRLRFFSALGLGGQLTTLPLHLSHLFTVIAFNRPVQLFSVFSLGGWLTLPSFSILLFTMTAKKGYALFGGKKGRVISAAKRLMASQILFSVVAAHLVSRVMARTSSRSDDADMTASDLKRCSLFGERPPMPSVATGLNGVEYPRGCYKGKEDTHHVFVIGDWGGVLEGDEREDDGRQTPPLHPLLDFLRDPGVDWAAQHHVRDRIVELAAEADPAFVLNVGDSFYGGGITEHCLARRSDIDFGAIPEQFLVGYEQVYTGPGLDGKEWMGVLGNHDYGGVCYNMGWPQQIWYTWNEHEQSSRRWVMPGQYYSRSVAFTTSSGTVITADMFFLDTNFYDTVTQHDRDICGVNGNTRNQDAPPREQNGWYCAGYLGNWKAHNNTGVCEGTEFTSPTNCASAFEKLWNEQLVWLEKGLSTSDADWQIIIMHHPPYYHAISKDINPLAKKYGVDLIVSGHVHNQELWYGTGVHDGQDWGKTAIIVSGGGGGIISELFRGTPRPDGNDNMYGFMDLAITKEVITISGYSWNVKNRSISVTTEGVLGPADGVPNCSGTYHPAVAANSYVMGYPRYEGGHSGLCSIYYSNNSTLGWVLNDMNGDWVSSSGNGYKISNGTWSTNPTRPDAPLYTVSISKGSLNRMLHAEVTKVPRDASAGGFPIKGRSKSAIDPCDASCESRGASYSCRDRIERIAWDANKGGPVNAVRTVNAECAGQCECTMPDADYIVAELPKSEIKRFVDDRFGPCEENKALCKQMLSIPFLYVRWRGFNLLDHTSIEWSDEYPNGTMPSLLVQTLYREWIRLDTNEYTERVRLWAPKSARGEILQGRQKISRSILPNVDDCEFDSLPAGRGEVLY